MPFYCFSGHFRVCVFPINHCFCINFKSIFPNFYLNLLATMKTIQLNRISITLLLSSWFTCTTWPAWLTTLNLRFSDSFPIIGFIISWTDHDQNMVFTDSGKSCHFHYPKKQQQNLIKLTRPSKWYLIALDYNPLANGLNGIRQINNDLSSLNSSALIIVLTLNMNNLVTINPVNLINLKHPITDKIVRFAIEPWLNERSVARLSDRLKVLITRQNGREPQIVDPIWRRWHWLLCSVRKSPSNLNWIPVGKPPSTRWFPSIRTVDNWSIKPFTMPHLMIMNVNSVELVKLVRGTRASLAKELSNEWDESNIKNQQFRAFQSLNNSGIHVHARSAERSPGSESDEDDRESR